jgi:ankyrin repeat protein
VIVILNSYRDNDGMTPLHTAAEYNSVDVMKLLCARATDLDVKSFSDFTALQLAAINGHDTCVDVSRVPLILVFSHRVKKFANSL